MPQNELLATYFSRRRQICEEQEKTGAILIHTLANAITFGFRDVVPTVQAL